MQGHVRKREGKRGSCWAFVLELPREANGKRRQKWQSGFRTRKEAQQALTRTLGEVYTGAYIEASKLPYSDLLERWMRDIVKPNRSPTTYDSYGGIIRKHLGPAFGAVPVSRLTAAQIQQFLAAQLAAGYARKTVRIHLTVLRMSLAQGVRWGMLYRNPTDLVEGPGEDETEKTAHTLETQKEILAAVAGTPLYLPAVVALSTGLRRGEVLGLRWSDLNFTLGTLTVRQALSASSAGLQFLPPKTKRSRRTLLLPPTLAALLQQHRQEQDALRDACPAWQVHDLVFPRPDGSPWHPSSFTSAWCKAMKAASIPACYHDWRHTHVSEQLAAGVPIQVVSERVGHAKTSTTSDVYGHLLPGQREDAAARADEALRRSLG